MEHVLFDVFVHKSAIALKSSDVYENGTSVNAECRL